MAKSSAINLNLPSVDDLLSTQESRDEAKLERVINLKPSEISDFPNHPFKVRMDEAMLEMTESVKQYGVLVPALVRPKPDGGHEMVAGHRRKRAAELAEREVPCIVRNLIDDEATIIMVDSNLQREKVLPSERAYAYKMRMEAVTRRQGQRTDLTSANDLQKLAQRQTSREKVAEKAGKSHETIRLYICLTNLIPELLDLADNAVIKDKENLQIALRPAVELSYLKKEEQADLFQIIQETDCTPSHAQTIKMRRLSEAKEENERLDKDVFVSMLKTRIVETYLKKLKEEYTVIERRLIKPPSPGSA